MTATVVPLARSVASWAAPSMPKASPDTTVASAAASAVAIRTAVDRPAGRWLVACRRPRPPARATSRRAGRARYRTCGGIAIAASRAGYDGSSTVTTPHASARSRPTMRSAALRGLGDGLRDGFEDRPIAAADLGSRRRDQPLDTGGLGRDREHVLRGAVARRAGRRSRSARDRAPTRGPPTRRAPARRGPRPRRRSRRASVRHRGPSGRQRPDRSDDGRSIPRRLIEMADLDGR